MVFHPSSSTGQHALDDIQSHSADLGYGWQSGLDASLTTSTSSIESEWTAGSILWDGEVIDIPSGSITHDAGDTENPRWDALAVTGANGNIQAIKGTPAPVATDDAGNEYRGEQAWTPSPSDQITRDMVVFALVWIPEGASNNDDLTNTSAGGVAEPVIDRRVEVPGQEEQVTRGTDITSSGWYRIASIGPVADGGQGEDIRANALFSVRDISSTLHSATNFWGSIFFDNNPTLSLQNTSYYSGTHGAITDIRLVHGDGTYEGAAIEVNVQLQGNSNVDAEYTISHNHAHQGWTPEPWTAGSVPTGFNTTQLDLSNDPIQAVAADGVDDMFQVRRDGTVVTETQRQRRVAASAQLNTSITAPGDGSVTKVPFDSSEGDWGAWDTSNGEFTAPRDGWYSVHSQVRWNQLPSSNVRMGTIIFASGYTGTKSWTNSGGDPLASGIGHGQFDLNAGDTIAVQVRQNSGSGQEIDGRPAETFCDVTYLG